MSNLRIISVNVIDSTHISVKFTANLIQNLSTLNVSIASQVTGIPDSSAVEVSVSGDTLEITCLPLTPVTAYFLTLQSTSSNPFTSINGDAILLEDGVANQKLIFGPVEAENDVKTNLVNYLRDTIYNTDNGTIISSYLDAVALLFSKALYDIKQVKNENYISTLITDEQKTRSSGPFDRLNEEGAYEILRVSKYKTGTQNPFSFTYSDFPSNPVSLQQLETEDSLTANSIDGDLLFNINTFVLNLSRRFVIKVNSITFNYSNGMNPYVYNISEYGYQILDSTYDQDNAFTYLLLNDNQIKLNEKILQDSNFSTQNISSIIVDYYYKDTGRIVSSASVNVYAIMPSGREVLPALENIFNLQHAPLTDLNGNSVSLNGISFINPNSIPELNSPHPAFLYEVPFRLDYLPSRPGEYSVDYSTGTVYVFGADNTQDGTGPTPPLAVYYYKYSFVSNVDYIYDEDLCELVALPNGSLTGNPGIINFTAEPGLALDIDYRANIHQESLNERIKNNLTSLGSLLTSNSPITNVFRIYNETSGEIYTPTRWNNNKVYFSYNKPPRLIAATRERATFEVVSNEILFVNNTISTSNPSINIFKILLTNNNIISQSEDCIGSSLNTSVSFSNNSIFSQEVYYDNTQSETANLTRLGQVGYYQINYTNGIVYVAVQSTQGLNIGSVSYKKDSISPNNPHVTSVEDIYYQFSSISQKEKHFDYISFSDGSIIPRTFDVSNERFLNNNAAYQYILSYGTVGTFLDSIFVAGVSQNIKFIRGVYEITDVLNNISPINFSASSTFNGTTLNVNPLIYNEYHTIQYDGVHYYITLNTPLYFLSPNISLNISVIRSSDSASLWNNSGTISLGNPLKLILPGINSPHAGDFVDVTYTFTINNFSSVIIDYNKGDYYIDYTYLADEILVSYEYGDNVLDFRQSQALDIGDTYYVSYRVGALRDALLKNFGTLINIPLLTNFSIDFERERYRDAIQAAMHSFVDGPTVSSIKNIVSTITHTPTEIIESAFNNWSLGNSILVPEQFSTTGSFALVPAKFGSGVKIDQPDQTIKLPVAGNLRIEEGTIESWVFPEWNGLDNLSQLTLQINKNGSPLPENMIFLGPSEYHPEYTYNFGTYSITIDKNSNVQGKPNKNKNGVFIYYDKDQSGLFSRWYLEVIDGYDDGYSLKNYNISIKTNGNFYDSKFLYTFKPATGSIFTGTNSLTYNITNDANVGQGITFIADNRHYLFDYGEAADKNRISIYKDESGYLNFKVYDKNSNSSSISADVSSWVSGNPHYISASWKINNSTNRDELHLFIDGLEVPNIIRYGNTVYPYLHEKFRTVNPEEIVGVIGSNIVASNDLVVIAGSNVVSSSLNFSAYGIVNGNTIYIEESGFSPSGYTITNVNGNNLTLSTTMPSSATGASFSVNKTTFNVSTEVSIYDNIAISLLHSALTSNDMQTFAGSYTVNTTTTNFTTHNILPGYYLRIIGGSFTSVYTILSVSSNMLVLNNPMPTTASNLTFFVYSNQDQEIPGQRALYPAYTINSVNNISIRDKALANDIVLIKTLGINHRRTRQRYYLWGNSSNIIKTQLPPPSSLSQVNIYKVLLTKTAIGPLNSTLMAGIFQSNNISTDQTTNNISGRSLSVSINGTNIDFSYPVAVSINGTIVNQITGAQSTGTETLSFTGVGSLGTLNTTNMFASVNYIQVNCKPINSTQNCLYVEVKERYSLTQLENNAGYVSNIGPIVYPLIRFSYQVSYGNTLDGYGNGFTVHDANNLFSNTLIGNYLHIMSPPQVAGYYNISGVSSDFKTLTLTQLSGSHSLPLPSFSNGTYEVLNISTSNSGLQNGFFTFESNQYAGIPYLLTQGAYDFDYYTYLSIPFEINSPYFYIGSNLFGNNQFDGVIDEFKITDSMLTDTRTGEIVSSSQETITKNYNSLKPLNISKNTLVMARFDVYPFVNDADFYITSNTNYIQSGYSVNSNFNKSISIKNNFIRVENDGILNTKTEGTIEFWINPIYDTFNDPNYRFYFDATSIVSENIVSTNNVTAVVSGKIGKVVSVKMQFGDSSIDYFVGGTVDSDGQTIRLNRDLPAQNTPVIVQYIPSGTNGNRISIYKDPYGYVNFTINADSIEYQVRAPIFWSGGSWHRIKASYKMNKGVGSDELRLFVDGYERGNILWGNGLIFGQGLVFGSSYVGSNQVNANLKFADTINEFYIGSDFTGNNCAYSLFDNLRISNISRSIYKPFGESIDPNYSSNLNIVLPVTQDLYTTLLLDFETAIQKNTDFSVIRNGQVGLFDFQVNVYDSFDLIGSNQALKNVLETLVNSLKPANSRVFFVYK